MIVRNRITGIAMAALVVGALLPSSARAAVVTNELEDISTSSLSDWTQVTTPAASRAGATLTSTGGTVFFHRSDLGLNGPNAFQLEAVLSAQALPVDGERGARLWVRFIDQAGPALAYWVEVRLLRQGASNVVALYDANSGQQKALLSVDWASGPVRVRIKRQEMNGIAYLLLQAEDAASWDDPAFPNNLNDPPRSQAVELTGAAGFAPAPAMITEVGFGNYLAGSYYSVWESVHWTVADNTTTVLPYWPPAPDAPGLAYVDQGTGSSQSVDLSFDTSAGYLSSDFVYAELDADGTTYTGADRASGSVEVWTFSGLGDQQSVMGRVVAREISGRSTVGSAAALSIPDRVAPAALSILRADASPTNATSVGWLVTFDEGVTSVDATDFALQWISGAGTSSLTSVTSISATTYTVTASGLDGDGTLRLDFAPNPSITDLAGNALSAPAVAGEEYVIDATAPTAPTVSGTTPTNDALPIWSWTTDGGGAGYYRYGLTEGDWLQADVTDTSYQPASGLTEGSHTLYVQERDELGNWSPSGSFAIVIDLTAPAAPIVTGESPTPDTTPTWSWSSGGEGAGVYRFGWEEGTWIDEAVSDTSYTPAAELIDGDHVLYVQQQDHAGNWSGSGSFTITVEPTDDATPDEPDDTSGCGCRTGSPESSPILPLCLVLAFVLVAIRRRR